MQPIPRLTFAQSPTGGVQIYNPVFRGMTDEQIITSMQYHEQYKPYGYHIVGYCQDIATVFLNFVNPQP